MDSESHLKPRTQTMFCAILPVETGSKSTGMTLDIRNISAVQKTQNGMKYIYTQFESPNWNLYIGFS